MKKYFDDESNVKKWNIWLKIIGTVITIFGFAIIIIQLIQFREQNETLQKQTELLNKSLVQTYRPIGVILSSPPDNQSANYEYLKIDGKIDPKTLKGTANIVFKPFLINKGNGVLVYIGHLYYLSDEEYSFRDRLLNGLLNPQEVQFDWNYSRIRQETLLPDENPRLISMRIDNIEIRDKYYFYSLILYEDQDGNLYDTEHMLYFEPEKLIDDKNKIVAGKIQKVIHRDVYSSYNKEEKSILLDFIKKRGHPMVQYFSQDSQPSSEAIKK